MGTGYVQLTGPRGGLAYSLTEVQDTWTAATDGNSLQLYEGLRGYTINQVLGSYSGGAGFMRVRNRITNAVKCLEPLALVTEERTRYCPAFVVEQDDVVEVIWVTTPT